jgi:hypothetical protein
MAASEDTPIEPAEEPAAEEPRKLTGLEKARAVRAENQRLRREGLLPPLQSRRKAKAKPQQNTKAVAADPGPASPPAENSAGGSILSADNLARIREEARKRVEAELQQRQNVEQQSLMAKMLDEETLRLRRAHGLTNHLDDIVEITINCPPFANEMLVDGVPYHHGFTYHVPRKLYDVLREQIARGWDSEDRAGNPNRKFYRDPTVTQNPNARLQRWGDGTIIARETTISGMTGAVSGSPVDGALSPG